MTVGSECGCNLVISLFFLPESTIDSHSTLATTSRVREKIMKRRTRGEPSHFLNRSLHDDDDDEEEEDDTSSWESGDQFMKMPEEESDEDDDYNESPLPPPPQPPQPERKHFCVICNRQFNSGKAYGGHVRIHPKKDNSSNKKRKTNNQMKMKMKIKKMKKGKRQIGLVVKKKNNKGKEKEIDLIRADVEGKIRCCLCGKEFQTMHSLFGHMRRHPDRSWKGIRPPPPSPSPEKYNNNLSFLQDDSSDDDDDDDVMSRYIDVAEDVQEAACNLMMLSYNSRIYSNDDSSPKSEVRSSSCVNGKEKVEEDDKGLIVDMKIEMEIEVKVNNPNPGQDQEEEEAKRSLGFDLNQPYQED